MTRKRGGAKQVCIIGIGFQEAYGSVAEDVGKDLLLGREGKEEHAEGGGLPVVHT